MSPNLPTFQARHAVPADRRSAALRAVCALAVAALVFVFWSQVQLVGTLVFAGAFVATLWTLGCLGFG
jgi:diacylglycerol kinase